MKNIEKKKKTSKNSININYNEEGLMDSPVGILTPGSPFKKSTRNKQVQEIMDKSRTITQDPTFKTTLKNSPSDL